MIHSGGLNAGHYFCFIRPEENNMWIKFNDTFVTPAMKHVAFCVGQGGYNSEFEMTVPVAAHDSVLNLNESLASILNIEP